MSRHASSSISDHVSTYEPITGSIGRPARSRFGYTTNWWGEIGRATDYRPNYWTATRHPSLCILFVLPLLILYEGGVRVFGGSDPDALRAGLELWLHQGFVRIGLNATWFPAFALVMGLYSWLRTDQSKPTWRLEPLAGMTLESLTFALGLIGLSSLVDLGLSRLESAGPPVPLQTAAGASFASARSLAFLGAGLYEEALFRLAMIPALFAVGRMLLLPGVVASVIAITGSSLLFSVAHHVGEPGEAFTWFAFVFRWLAGVYFSWVFVSRGFGIAVGTHAAYDCLVGWLSVPT